MLESMEQENGMKGAVLAVPACEAGRGGGHLTRCMALVRGLRALGRQAWLLSPHILDSAQFDRRWLITDESGLPHTNWECVVLDRFQTPPEELARWEKLAPVIGIDEGGLSRNNFDFLIDVLPNCSRIKPNIADLSLLPLPEKNEKCEEIYGERKKILVSFGQEDTAKLGMAVVKALAVKNNNIEITLLQGELSNSTSPPPSPPLTIKTIEIIPNLNEHLNEYDLIITHFGLTAFEALYSGVPVLLVSPGAYHEKLAKKSGFYSLGVGKSAAKKLPRLLLAKTEINRIFILKLKKRCAALAVKYHLEKTPRQSLAELINNAQLYVSRNCPVCGTPLRGPVIARFPERSYRVCKRCGIIHMNRLSPPPVEYGREYFFEAYQKQYGKTYIEDFPNLIAMGKRRLAVIKSLLSQSGTDGALAPGAQAPALFDIGCAYGPFLAAAREEGFSPYGIDPAEDAVRYVSHVLNIPAMQGFFPLHEKMRMSEISAREGVLGTMPHGAGPMNETFGKEQRTSGEYAVVSLWYVIEHLRNCVPVFQEIKGTASTPKLLKTGGVLAFATPSFSGISGRSSIKRFLEHSPADHWTIWSPAACRKALTMAGFSVKKIVNCGHHPERFPLLGKYARTKKSPLYWIFLALSKTFSLGDTFEAYAKPLIPSSTPFPSLTAFLPD